MKTHKEQFPDIVMVLALSVDMSAPLPVCPPKYKVRTYRDGDESAWKRIQQEAVGHKSANLSKWWPAYQDVLVDEGLYFIEHMPSGRLVSTTGAISDNYGGMFPNGGALGWVATVPGHRKVGLSYLLTHFAVRRLVEEGISNIFLTTDEDFPEAIRMYYKFGFRPCLYAEGIESRWKALCDITSLPFEPKKWSKP